MTIWKPILESGGRKYMAIADAIERDVSEGRLSEGEQLPTHRELADALGVTVGTITRAYAEAERRGLTVGEVGRGTFVRREKPEVDMHRWGIGGPVPPSAVDMRHSLPPELPELERQAMDSVFDRLTAVSPSELLRLPGESALAHHREAGAEWLRWCGLSCDGDEVLYTLGVQHGLTASLMTLLEPRDVLLAGEFTYPGLRTLASMLGLRLRPIALDDQGMVPDAIERACRAEPRPRALYVVPTIHNPTCGTLSPSRRADIARIAEKYDLLVLEDQIHGLVTAERLAPITTLIPERAICLASPSKSLAPGLRVGFMKSPSLMKSKLLTGINSTIWTVPPIAAEVFSLLMQSGAADEILRAKREETSRRHEIVDDYLSGFDMQRDRSANHLWLKLPDSWSEQGFVRAAEDQGVLVPGSETFAVGRNDGFQAVRVAIGLMSVDQLKRALGILRDLLKNEETPALTVI